MFSKVKALNSISSSDIPSVTAALAMNGSKNLMESLKKGVNFLPAAYAVEPIADTIAAFNVEEFACCNMLVNWPKDLKAATLTTTSASFKPATKAGTILLIWAPMKSGAPGEDTPMAKIPALLSNWLDEETIWFKFSKIGVITCDGGNSAANIAIRRNPKVGGSFSSFSFSSSSFSNSSSTSISSEATFKAIRVSEGPSLADTILDFAMLAHEIKNCNANTASSSSRALFTASSAISWINEIKWLPTNLESTNTKALNTLNTSLAFSMSLAATTSFITSTMRGMESLNLLAKASSISASVSIN